MKREKLSNLTNLEGGFHIGILRKIRLEGSLANLICLCVAGGNNKRLADTQKEMNVEDQELDSAKAKASLSAFSLP